MPKIKWYKLLSRQGVDALTVSVIDVAFYDAIWKLTNSKEELLFSTLDKKVFTHYIGINPKEFGKYLFKNYFNSKEKIIKLYHRGSRLIKNDEKVIKKWKKQIKSGSDDNVILSAFKDFKKSFIEINYFYTVWPWPAVEYWQEEFEKIISELIKKSGLEKDRDYIIASAYKPWREIEIIKLQKEIRTNKDISSLVDKYQFLRSWSAVWYNVIDEEWIKSIISKNQKKQKIYTKSQLVKLLKPNLKQKKFLDLAPYIIFYKDYRDDVRRKYVYIWSFLFDLIAEKYKVERDDVGLLSIEELQELIKTGKVDRQKIKRRNKNLCVVTVDGKNLKMRVEDKATSRYKKIISKINTEEKSLSITGLIAQKGKVTGKVRIINTFHDIKNVLAGDILVANTTHPNYLPAMQKAGAFITNEGGIISHAAIVAREMKKPCIVGTKIATKVLKDGDMVEVDADSGVVRKI